jgi:hypothetical protein
MNHGNKKGEICTKEYYETFLLEVIFKKFNLKIKYFIYIIGMYF